MIADSRARYGLLLSPSGLFGFLPNPVTLVVAAALGLGLAPSAEAQSASGGPVEAEDRRDPAHFQDLSYRTIGPYRGGRVTAVEGLPGTVDTYYMGTVGGGVWRTDDAGEQWTNISDGAFRVGSIGAVEAAPSDPDVLYVGTGSACIRGNVSTGRGVYRSTDGGETWDLMGLEEAGQIGAVRVHPDDPDRIYVAALGHPFGPNEERGVFRSTDGGENWEKVLFISDSTGVVDLAMNPENPREIYAAAWRAERKPWTLVDGAREGGVYRSTDGGDSWEKLGGGLPTGLVGRIGLAVSPADPDRVWALVTAKDPEGGLYRSDDGGDHWTRVNREHRLRQRGWYYSHVIADPEDPNTVYALNTGMYRSVDGGKSFEEISVPHGDVHALWVNSRDPEAMVVGNDGGAQVSLDHGETWSSMYNQPTAEFYRVEVDDQFPYRVYGAQQDNSTLSLPAWSAGGVHPKQRWYSVGGGESGHIAVHPEDPDVVYAGSYIGRIDRFNRETGRTRNMIIYPQMGDGVAPKNLEYRFQWNAPIEFSPFGSQPLYHTSNHVHRTSNGGMSWETISPDLTQNDTTKQFLPGGPLQHDHTGVEVYGTIFAFTPSPHQRRTLWAGSDDGLIHLSRDTGRTWTDVTPEGMPEDGTVNVLEVSPHAPGTVYAAVYRYRMDDFTPYVFRTTDYGESWTRIADGTRGIPDHHPVRVVREDPEREGLLYAGTEFGLFVSFDDGGSWQSFRLAEPPTRESSDPEPGALPVTPVTDLEVHRNDLVVATQGRGFWILDELAPVRQLGDDVASGRRHLYRPPVAFRVGRGGYYGERAPESPPQGAVLDYFLAQAAEGEVTLEVLQEDGDVVRRFTSDSTRAAEEGGPASVLSSRPLPSGPGHHRVTWNLLYPGPELVDDAVMSLSYTGGIPAVPGSYRIRMSAGEWSQTRTLEVQRDPRLDDVSRDDLREQFDLMVRVRDMLTRTHDALRRVRDVREQLQDLSGRLEEHGRSELAERADTLAADLTEVERALIQTQNESPQDPINYPPQIDNQIAYLYSHLAGAYGRPTEGSRTRFRDLREELAPTLERLTTLLEDRVSAYNRALEDGGVDPVMVPDA